MKIREHYLDDYTKMPDLDLNWANRKTVWGISPIAPIHLGFDSQILLQKQAVDLQVKRHTLLLADIHASMSHKLSLSEIKKRSFYYEFYFRDICKLENTDFVLGSSFQTKSDYVEHLYNALRKITLKKTYRAMVSAKKNEPIYCYVSVYPLMQCLDIFYHSADVVLAGSGQKKIYKIVKDLVENHSASSDDRISFGVDFDEVNFIYTELPTGINGQRLKESCSKTRISIHESESSLKKKFLKCTRLKRSSQKKTK